MKLKRGKNLTKKRETVMMLQKGNYILNRKKSSKGQDRSRGKKIGDNINKLRGKITDKDKKVVLYTAENEQILNTLETVHEIERYWSTIYRKHQNEIDKVWNKEKNVFIKN